MKKVLIVATVQSHIARFHTPLMEALKKKNCEVHIAGKDNLQEKNGLKVEYADKMFDIPFSRSPFSLTNIKAYKLLKKIIDSEKYDIIHCHTPMGGVITRLAAKKSRKVNQTKVFYTAHGFHFFKGAPLKNWLLYYPVEKFLTKYTDELFTINREDYSFATNKFNKRCKSINYVPGVGINLDKFNIKYASKDQEQLRKKLNIKKDDFVLISIGELNDNKNQILQIEVMKELVKTQKNIKLLIAGSGSNLDYYSDKINEYNLNKNIKLLGYRNDIEKLLSISNILISTSKREGLPVNVMEALGCSTPVVALDCRGMNDLITDGVNGYIININSNDKISEFVAAIENLYNDSEKYNKIKDSCRSSVLNFSIENVIKEMIKIYFKKK